MMRASVLAEHKAVGSVTIDVLAFQPRLGRDVKALKRQGHLHHDVQVRSVLRALDESPPEDNREPIASPEDPDLVPTPLDTGSRHIGYHRDGVRVMEVRKDAQGVIMRVDYFDASARLTRRQVTDETGRLAREELFPESADEAAEHRYIGRDGRCFLSIWVPQGSRQWHAGRVHGESPRDFADMGDLYRFAYERMLSVEPAPVLCSEFRENLFNLPKQNLDDVVRSVRHPGLRRIAVAHSSHLSPPYTSGSPVSPTWQRLLDGLNDFDALVAWTEEQCRELGERVTHPERLHAIPPAAPPERKATGDVDRNRLILVARTHRKKRVDEAIQVFRRVLAGNPSARLEIFGFGYGDEEEKNILRLVEELDIQDRVRFMPFAKNRDVIYDRACAMILTSASEGFGLVLLESMSYGVPVVAYDSNYGPREVVREGVNGYLVPFGDREGAADHVIQIMGDPQLHSRLSDGARRTLQRFSTERFVEGWTQVLQGPPGDRGRSVRLLFGRDR